MPGTIHQTVEFNAPAHDIYEMLMDSDKHAAFTESPAEISKEVGGSFTAYGDYIEGTNTELSPDKKIVQSWRASDWPDEHFSTATYELSEQDGKTIVTFTQENVPDDFMDDIAEGWNDYYWDKMKKMLK